MTNAERSAISATTAALCLLAGAAARAGGASTLQPFPGGSAAGGFVESAAVFNAGDGPRLFVGGSFGVAGGDTPVELLAAWDGAAWTAAPRLNDVPECMTVFDDGDGPALFLGGRFTMFDGAPASHIVRWDGESASDLGGANGPIYSMTVADLGDGPALYVGGEFTEIGGVAAANIARWNGVAWSALDVGANGRVVALAGFDEDGAGPAPQSLFVGGSFGALNGLEHGLRRWSGGAWSNVVDASGDSLGSGYVTAMAVYDDGGGGALYFMGTFSSLGGVVARNFGGWDGVDFIRPGTIAACAGPGSCPPNLIHSALAVFDDGSGAALYLLGDFAYVNGAWSPGLARFNGAALTPMLGGNVGGHTLLEAEFDGQSRLFIGGQFNSFGTPNSRAIVEYGADGFDRLGGGVKDHGFNGTVTALGAAGGVVYAGGDFDSASGQSARKIAQFGGFAFQGIGGLNYQGVGGSARVNAIRGFGDDLIIGGRFNLANGVAVSNITAWDGADFRNIGSGGTVLAMELVDLGQGALLYIAHDTLQGSYNWRVWDGLTLDAPGFPLLNHETRAVAQFDDGSGAGPALIAGGKFTASGATTLRHLGAWRAGDAQWTEIGGGVVGGDINAMAVRNDGAEDVLYIGGDFTKVNGNQTAKGLAAWDGETWTTFPAIVGSVSALAWFDDGAGPALYVGGDFTMVGALPVTGFARIRNGAWEPLQTLNGAVRSLLVEEVQGVSTLFVGGEFTAVDNRPSARLFTIASGAAGPCPGDANGDNVIDFQDLNAVVSSFNAASGDPGYNPGADFDADGDVDFADLNVVVSAFNSAC